MPRTLLVLAAELVLSSAAASCRGEPSVVRTVTRRQATLQMRDRDAADVQIPDTVRAGESFPVTMTSSGNGCVTAGDTEVRVADLVADVTPYDIQTLVNIDGSTECLDVLSMFRHATTLQFARPGQALVRVHARVPGDAPVIIARRVVVR